MQTKVIIILTMIALMVCFGTVTRLNAGDAYSLNGEWNAVYDSGGWGIFKDVIRITQEENQFIGIYLYKGELRIGKNEEKIKGKLKLKGFDEVYLRVVDHEAFEVVWDQAEGNISEDGNNIVIRRMNEYKGAKTIQTITLERK